MRDVQMSFPKLAFLAATRGILGAGIGMLTSQSLNVRKRRSVGRVLLTIGIVSTIPLALDVLSQRTPFFRH